MSRRKPTSREEFEAEYLRVYGLQGYASAKRLFAKLPLACGYRDSHVEFVLHGWNLARRYERRKDNRSKK